eukprot:g2544.t1
MAHRFWRTGSRRSTDASASDTARSQPISIKPPSVPEGASMAMDGAGTYTGSSFASLSGSLSGSFQGRSFGSRAGSTGSFSMHEADFRFRTLTGLDDDELLEAARRARLEVSGAGGGAGAASGSSSSSSSSSSGGGGGGGGGSDRPSGHRGSGVDAIMARGKLRRGGGGGGNKRIRSNTTNSMYLTSTMQTADTETTIKCIAAVIYQRIQLSGRALRKVGKRAKAGSEWDVYGNDWTKFNDMGSRGAVPRGIDDMPPPPNPEDVAYFIRRIFTKAQMERDSLIIALIYVERLLKSSEERLKLGPHNWMTVVFCGLLIASKVWDDLSMWNSDFSQISPGLTLERVNVLEVDFLRALDFSVRVPASSYAKYYFQLRTMCSKLGHLGLKEELLTLGKDHHMRRGDSVGAATAAAAAAAVAGTSFDDSSKPTGVALEQIVTMQRESLVGAPDDAYMRPISLGRSKK